VRIKIKGTLAILLFLLGPTACENCGEETYYSINGLKIYNFKYTGLDPIPIKTIEDGESSAWDKFFVQVGFEETYYTENRKSGGYTLFADCWGKGSLGSKIGLDTLYLITLKDYNDEYLQNDTLNSIILANDLTNGIGKFNNFYSLTKFVQENKASIPNHEFVLKINEPPSKDIGEYQFKLILILNGGKTFENESRIVKLIK